MNKPRRVILLLLFLSLLQGCAGLGMGSLGSVSGVGNSGLGSNATAGADGSSSDSGYDEIRTIDIYAPIAKMETPDALKVTGSSDGVSSDFTSFLLSQFLGQAFAVDSSATTVTLSGLAGAVGAEDNVLFYDDSGLILQTVQADSEGAFSAEFDSSYLDTPIHLATYTEEPAERSYSVTVNVHYANYWQTSLLDEASLVNTDPVFSGSYLIYTTESEDATGGYSVSFQSMHGGAVESFATTDVLVRQLQAPNPAQPSASPIDNDIFLVGVTPGPDFDVVRLNGDDTLEVLSDSLDQSEDYISRQIGLQPLGRFVLTQAVTREFRATPLTLLSTTPEPDQTERDIVLPPADRTLKSFTRTFAWANNSTVVSLTGYAKIVRGVPSQFYRAEVYDLSQIVALTDDELEVANNSPLRLNALSYVPEILFDSLTEISNPVVSHTDPDETSTDGGFFAYECAVGNVTQICLSRYDSNPSVITLNRTQKSLGSVSLNNDFIAFVAEKTSSNIQISVYHVPTGNTIPITVKKFDEGSSSVNIEPHFSTDSDHPYVMSYLCSEDEQSDSVKLSPCVLDLANHKLAGTYVPGSPYYRLPE